MSYGKPFFICCPALWFAYRPGALLNSDKITFAVCHKTCVINVLVVESRYLSQIEPSGENWESSS
jgi:hypothetical protein